MRRAGPQARNAVSRVRAYSPWRRLLVVSFAVLLLVSAASAQTDLYTIRGNATAGSNNIWNVDPTTGAEILVYSGYPGGNAATLAQRPSDGMIFYAINGTNGAVFSFNPATPNIAPVAIGNLGPTPLGVNVSGGFRMAFSPAGALYYMVGTGGAADPNTLYTVNQSTGQATKLTTITGAGDGGDMAFSGATIYIVDQNRILSSATTAGGAATTVGTISFGGATPNTIGMAFDSTGRMLLQTVSGSGGQFWSVTGTTATLISTLSGGATATGDMASAAVPAPNLSITKTDGVATVYRGGPVAYTIVVTNSSAYPVTGTVTDTVPASVTGVTWTCAASAGSACTAASGSGNAISTSATLLVGGTATYTVSGAVSAAASGTLTNTANVAVPSWLTDSTPANNTASDSDTINLNANLGITKTDGLANINPGSAVTYTIVVSNAGPDASNGSIVTDTVPATITGVTWTCGSATGGATCGGASGSGNSISTTANLPSGGSVTYTVSGTLATTATGTLSNTATVVTPASGVTDPNDAGRTGAGNNSATDNTPINSVPDARLAKSHSGNFTVGVNGTYTLTASNSGTLATSGTITVVDNLPTGLTVAAIPTGTGWNCSTTVVGSSTATCTSSTVIAAGATSPNPITLTVVVAAAAFPSVTNAATISGGGEPATLNGNNSANDPTTVNGAPDLTINKSHVGNFTQGQVGATYSITATNSGTAATSGTVTVTDTLPSGLTATAISGTGWSCVLGTLTCTRSDALAAGSSYPVITLTVTVANNAASSVTNSVSVSGGGQNNTTNDTATNPTTINQLPDLTITKSHVGNFTQGQVGATYSITATNSGFAATSGTVTVIDTLPAGLTATAISGTGWSCVLGTLTCTRSDALAAGSSYPVITVTVTVANNAASSVTNSVGISGGGQTNTANDSANDVTTIDAGPPIVTLVKSVNPTGAQLPGADLTYTIAYTNSGGKPAQSFIIVDPNPLNADPLERVLHNVDFKIGSMTSSPGTTGLVATFSYSNNGGSTWTYTPVSGGGGAPAGYDRNVTNIRWTFAGNLSQTSPNNTGSVTFIARIR